MNENSHRQRFWFTTREILLIVLLIAVATACWLDHARLVQRKSIRYVDPQSVSAISIGMNQSDVRSQLGHPHNVGELKGLDVWHYFHGPSVHFIFDKTGRVQAINRVE
jgi:outer membrane protein assembly factor BamE (lipoprotein component of BamABCDE complex)